MAELRRHVEKRLYPYAEIGAIQWLEWFDSKREIPSEEIVRACGPLLRLDLWQRLVESGYQSKLPDVHSPAQVQIIVVWDAITENNPDISQSVRQFVKSTQDLKDKAELSLALVLLTENSNAEISVPDTCWPRVQLSTTALGGAEVERERVLQSTQHILTALVSSNLTKKIDTIVSEKKDSVKWIVLGTSALLSDLPPHRRELRQATLQQLLRPQVASSLTDLECQRVEEIMKEQVMASQEALLEDAVAGLRESGWWVNREGLSIQQCCLVDPELLDETFGQYQRGVPTCVVPSTEGARRSLVNRVWSSIKETLRDAFILLRALNNPFLPDKDLSDKLSEHYLDLRGFIEFRPHTEKEQGLAYRIGQEYEDLKQIFASFLDRGLDQTEEGISALPQLEVPLPVGLQAAIRAVVSTLKRLSDDGDILDARAGRAEWVRPAPLASERYQEAAAEADADLVRGSLRRYRRFVRTLASWPSVFLKLVPAWLLLSGLLELLFDWSTGRSVTTASVALAVIGIGDLIYWWLIRARRLLESKQEESHQYLTDRILTLTARGIKDYRLLMMTRLWKTFFVLDDLYRLLLERYKNLKEERRPLKEVQGIEQGAVYRLADWEQVLEWGQLAVEKINRLGWLNESEGNESEENETEEQSKDYDSAITALIARNVWPLAERPAPSQAIIWRLEQECRRHAEEVFKPEVLEPVVIAQKLDTLKSGRHWEWLWQHAQPLGKAGATSQSFTIILAQESALMGNTGRDSRYWRSEWLEACTHQSHEVICVRGAIERK
jgi:hypothetical protein